MEREIIELRKQIAGANSGAVMHQQQPIQAGQLTPKQESNQVSPAGVYQTQTPSAISTDQYMGSQEAVASLLDLRSGYDGSNYMRNGNQQFKRIEDVIVVPEKVTELFNLYGPQHSMLTSSVILHCTGFSHITIRFSHSWTDNNRLTIITITRLCFFGQ